MNKNSVKNFVLPFTICLLMALALYPDLTLNSEVYSTEGLELNYNISKDLVLVSKEQSRKQNI